MATAKKGQVVLRGGFPTGTRVGLYEAIGDTFTASLPKVGAKQRVDKHSEATFDGLEIGKPYFVAAEVDGEWRSRRVVGKDPALVRGPMKPPRRIGAGQVVHNVSEERLENAASLRSQTENPEIISGARASNSTRVRGHAKPTDPLAIEQDTTTDKGRQDGLAPLGSKDEPKQLASDTFAGVAVPAAPDRLQQEDVPKGVPQASATELGDAAILVDVVEPPLGDTDPNRASGDSAVGPAGTVAPVDFEGGEKPPKSTSKVTRDAERSAKRKRAGAKRRPSKKTQRARVRRAEQRNAAERATTGDLTPGTNPVADAGDEPQTGTPARRPDRARVRRPTRDARTPKRLGDSDAAKAAKRAAKNARERERRAAKRASRRPPANA